nr:hypothetical protein CFP56_12290 [Quercus suber]
MNIRAHISHPTYCTSTYHLTYLTCAGVNPAFGATPDVPDEPPIAQAHHQLKYSELDRHMSATEARRCHITDVASALDRPEAES